jgi:hypothetical protein
MDSIVSKLTADYPGLKISRGETFYWSSQDREIFYVSGGNPSSLLHEMGHALLGHRAFGSDMDLLSKEVAAWEKARELARVYAVPVDEENIQQCLDTYRDWLYMRSSCPACKSHGVQHRQKLYRCLNCFNTWKVSGSVLCRAYRQRKSILDAK